MGIIQKPKSYLFIGLALIAIALICKAMGWGSFFYLFLFSGIVLKIIFLVLSIHQGRIKVGLPLYILLCGVVLVVLGAFMRRNEVMLEIASAIIILGVVLKCFFVVLTIVKKLKSK